MTIELSPVQAVLLIAIVLLAITAVVLIRHFIVTRRAFRSSDAPLIHHTTPLDDDSVYPRWFK